MKKMSFSKYRAMSPTEFVSNHQYSNTMRLLISKIATMRGSVVGNGVIILLVFVLSFDAFSAFPSRPDERSLANNEKYQWLKELLPSLRELSVEDKLIEEKRNQEVMTAFNNMKELKEILRSG